MTGSKHEDAKNQPYAGDLFIQPASGRVGVIRQVFEDSDVLDVELFDSGDASSRTRTPKRLELGSLELRRPPIGAEFGLDTRTLEVNTNTVQIVRHLENGFVEVRMVVHAEELLEPVEGFKRRDLRTNANPANWPAVKLEP
jgi:hypothetical protein